MKTQTMPVPGKSASELNADFDTFKRQVEKSYKQVFNQKLTLSKGSARVGGVAVSRGR